ncbi:hypothetical protein STENM327S_02591 [Streptomyces tendae]
MTITYLWRGDVDNALLEALHADGFGHPVEETDWRARLERHSLGWVCARQDGSLVGFVNVAWDGGAHAFLLDTVVARHCRSRGVGARLVEVAAERNGPPGASGCTSTSRTTCARSTWTGAASRRRRPVSSPCDAPGGRHTGAMIPTEPKADLRFYLQAARDALLWKLDGLSEYDIRRPATPTGTNLLGLVKHAAGVELGYLGDTFGRPSGEPLPWLEDGAGPNVADMWATADESRIHRGAVPAGVGPRGRDDRRAGAGHGRQGALVAGGQGRGDPAPCRDPRDREHHRHAGHADILRELTDGAVGMREDNTAVPTDDAAWWEAYRDRLEHAAREAGRRETPGQAR